MIPVVIDVFIIIQSSNLEDFSFANRMFDKDIKQGMLYHYMFL